MLPCYNKIQWTFKIYSCQVAAVLIPWIYSVGSFKKTRRGFYRLFTYISEIKPQLKISRWKQWLACRKTVRNGRRTLTSIYYCSLSSRIDLLTTLGMNRYVRGSKKPPTHTDSGNSTFALLLWKPVNSNRSPTPKRNILYIKYLNNYWNKAATSLHWAATTIFPIKR